jgi:predicted DsbA family dithiol-disulfide isomerase
MSEVGLNIDVIADVVCPWSFLGKRRLDRALVSYTGPMQIVWHPFQLNPDLPPEGVDFDTYLNDRFGSRAQVSQALAQLQALGSDNGIAFNFAELKRVPNTLAAHRLMVLGRERDLQSELAESLFRAFFEAGRDIGDPEVLVELAAGLGVPEAAARDGLADDASLKIVAAEEAQARQMGFVATPNYLFNRRVLLPGAPEVDTLVDAFAEAVFPSDPDADPILH